MTHAEKVCREVRETEAAYIADLQTVLSVYVRPAVERRILTLEDTLSIFANLEELCRCATVLHELMDWPGDSVSVLAQAFIQVSPFFKLYAYYCRNYEKALGTLARCRKHVSGFSDFLNKQSTLAECKGMNLESFLIKPVQRLTKYPLFWKDLLKATPHTPGPRQARGPTSWCAPSRWRSTRRSTSRSRASRPCRCSRSSGSEWMALHRTPQPAARVRGGGARRRAAVRRRRVRADRHAHPVQARTRRCRRQPWLLVELPRLVVTQPLSLDAMMRKSGRRAPRRSPATGCRRRPDGPRACLRASFSRSLMRCHVGPRRRPPWMAKDETAAYHLLVDKLTALSEEQPSPKQASVAPHGTSTRLAPMRSTTS